VGLCRLDGGRNAGVCSSSAATAELESWWEVKFNMADQNQQLVNIPGLGAVQVVVIKLPNGQVALRHPSELIKQPPSNIKVGGAS
jgi:D-alanyl-D-alanine carboxypeptidase